MCETSNRAAALRQWRCSAMIPAGYCTGRLQPAKSTMRPPSSRWRSWSGVRRARRALEEDGSLKAGTPRAVGRTLARRRFSPLCPRPESIDAGPAELPACALPLRWSAARPAGRRARSPECHPPAVRWPESFRGGCSFGARAARRGGRRGLSREAQLAMWMHTYSRRATGQAAPRAGEGSAQQRLAAALQLGLVDLEAEVERVGAALLRRDGRQPEGQLLARAGGRLLGAERRSRSSAPAWTRISPSGAIVATK